MGEILNVEGGLAGERPEHGTPLPNKADAAWAELEQLRKQAVELGVEVDERWPIARLREEIDAVGGDGHG